MSENEKVIAAVEYANGNISVESDISQYAVVDYWMDPRGVLYYEAGDSEDFAFLVHSLLLNGTVSGTRLRTYFGFKNSQAYAWLTYKRQSDNEWVILDAAAETVSDIDSLPLAKNNNLYNDAYAYLTDSAYITIPPGEYISTYDINSANIVFPLFLILGYSGGISSFSFPLFSVVASGRKEVSGSGSTSLPLLQVLGTGKSGSISIGNITLKIFSCSATGFQTSTGPATITWIPFKVFGAGSKEIFSDDYILRFIR